MSWRCFFLHAWTKWELKNRPFADRIYIGQSYYSDCIERYCERCGRIQRKELK